MQNRRSDCGIVDASIKNPYLKQKGSNLILIMQIQQNATHVKQTVIKCWWHGDNNSDNIKYLSLHGS